MELSATGHRPIGLAAILRFSVVAAAILLSAACTKTAETADAFADDQPAGTLYNEGLAYLNGGKLTDAVKSFDEVDRQHPYSEWARKALVMSAFASYRRGRYNDTVIAANRYLTLYPGSPDAAYAQFLIGSSYFHQIPDITRDQDATRKAMAALQEIVDRYPDSEYATDAKNKIIDVFRVFDTLKTSGLWEKAVQASTKKDASGKTTQYGYAGTTDASYFNAMVLSRGGKIMNDDNKTVAWAGKEGLETLQMLDRLYKGGYAYTPSNFDWQNDFGTKLAFVFQSTSSRPFIAAAMKQPVNWTVGNPPGGKTVMFGANVAVLKSSPQKQLASWLFIKWFSDDANTADWATKSYYMPVRKSAANSETLKTYWTSKDPQGKQAYDIIGASIPEPNIRGQQDIRDVIQNMIVSVTTNKATPEAAIKDAETKANQILKDAQ